MGCDNSKVKDSDRYCSSDEFDKLVNEVKHPVAIKLKEEWLLFANAYRARSGDAHDTVAQQEAIQQLAERPDEVWANTEQNPVKHASVDEVGKAFLNYVRNQLLFLGWGGNFEYRVAGVVDQGFIKASAELDVSSNDYETPVIRTWSKKLHYHSFT